MTNVHLQSDLQDMIRDFFNMTFGSQQNQSDFDTFLDQLCPSFKTLAIGHVNLSNLLDNNQVIKCLKKIDMEQKKKKKRKQNEKIDVRSMVNVNEAKSKEAEFLKSIISKLGVCLFSPEEHILK